MFRNIYDSLTKNSLLDESFKIIDKISHQTHEMFEIASESLIVNEIPEEDLLKMDKSVNKAVVDIRRKVLEYFAVTTTPNYHAGMILISLAVDYERIGDYTKKLYDLRNIFDFRDPFNPEVEDILRAMRHDIMVMFPEAYKSLEKKTEKYPNKVTEKETEVRDNYEIVLRRIQKRDISKQEALVAATYSGKLIRIAGHLDNIGSSAGRPFPKLGFKPGSSSWIDD
ncbi:MAG: PhoU domain-containing protein [Thermoplasmatota archaeon]